MHLLLAALLLAVATAGCGTNQSSPTPIDEPFGTAPPLLPLPANLSGIPGPGDPSAEIAPTSPAGEMGVAGQARNFMLGHCGLISPIDVDGSLWDPIGYYTVGGGPLTEAQEGELINSTPTVVRLSTPNTLELRTPSQMTVVLSRHDGPRRYFLCD